MNLGQLNSLQAQELQVSRQNRFQSKTNKKGAVHSNRPRRRFDLLLLILTAIFEYNYITIVIVYKEVVNNDHLYD
jgi:hypothetical protein